MGAMALADPTLQNVSPHCTRPRVRRLDVSPPPSRGAGCISAEYLPSGHGMRETGALTISTADRKFRPGSIPAPMAYRRCPDHCERPEGGSSPSNELRGESLDRTATTRHQPSPREPEKSARDLRGSYDAYAQTMHGLETGRRGFLVFIKGRLKEHDHYSGLDGTMCTPPGGGRRFARVPRRRRCAVLMSASGRRYVGGTFRQR